MKLLIKMVIHRIYIEIHLIPYYPKEPVIFPFIQQYNPHLFNDCHSNTNDQINNSDEDKFTDEEQFPSTTFNKETDIPSTIDLQPEPFNQYSSFPYKQKEQIPQNTSPDNQSDIHDYDNLLIPEDTPIIDTISRHNQEKTTDSSLVKRILFHFLKNPAEIRNTERNTHKESLKERKSLKLNAKIMKFISRMRIKERNPN